VRYYLLCWPQYSSRGELRLTYDATLAELTSLEEMMRYMMDDDQIHSDVVNKLWQVYSEHGHKFSYYH
jgi:condensin complex subunit 1